jgi:MFS family permease
MPPDRPANKWLAFATIGLSLVTIVMATSMVFVMLDAIAADFGITLRSVGWVVIVESLIISALLLPMGGVADRIGRRRVYVAGLSIFGVGAVLAGLAPTFVAFIAARVIMSIGNALVQSVMTAMIVWVFPPEERGRAVGGQTTAVSVGAAFGPLLAGFALQVVSWEALFVFLAVPSALAVVAALVVLPADGATLRAGGSAVGEEESNDRQPFDPLGGVLAAAVVVALVLTIGNPLGLEWVSLPILGGLVAVIVSLAAFVWWELKHRAPMLDVRLFGQAVFRRSVSIRFLGFVGFATTTLLLPVYLISLRGLADGVAGSIVFIVAVGMGLSAQVAGRLSDRVGPRPPSTVGLTLQIVVAIVLIAWADGIPLPALAVVVFAAGFASGLWNVPNNSTMMGEAPPDGLAVVGAFSNVTRTMGTVVGQAIATALVVGVMASQGFEIPLNEIAETPGAGAAFIDGWRAAYLAIAVASAVALAIALRYPARNQRTLPASVEPRQSASGREEVSQ